MRPAGEVRQTLMRVCRVHARAERGLTVREWAELACVGLDAAQRTVENMARAGQVCKLKDRTVTYRNRPVAEYVPAELMPKAEQAAPEPSGCMRLSSVLQVWAG